MTRPTKHPKTGVYRIRIGVPEALRETTKRAFGVSREFQASLGTKDWAEAKRLAPAVVERLGRKLAQARAVAAAKPLEPLTRDLAALAGEWYRKRLGLNGGNPNTEAMHTEIWLALRGDDLLAGKPDCEDIIASADGWAEGLLIKHGFSTDEESRKRLAAMLVRAEVAAGDTIKRKAEGDWSPDPNLAKFPKLPARLNASPAPSGPGCTFDALLAGFALDRGWKEDANRIDRAFYDRKRTLERLADFLGHRDADQLSKADAVRWKESIQGRGRGSATVRNDLSEMSAIWAWGIRNGKLRAKENPFIGILPPKPKKRTRDPRAFTDEEAARILQAARDKRGFMRWLPWVLCLTGARLNEIGQATKEDIGSRDGVPVIRIHDEGEGRTLKNADSKRTVPLHPALIGEGFLDYVAKLPAGSPLWPDVEPDGTFGLRSVNAGKRIGRWLRGDLGITDPQISPMASTSPALLSGVGNPLASSIAMATAPCFASWG